MITQSDDDPNGECPECGSRKLRGVDVTHRNAPTETDMHSARKRDIMKMPVKDHRVKR